jgi:hypothetical protein
MSTSIIIPLGHGSHWNNLELRYCLRSIEKYLTGYGDIFIVGEKPDWVCNIIHIPCPDYGDKTYDKERNIYTKIMTAIADERVTEDFLFMNDDHYLLRGYETSSFPYYFDSTLGNYKTVTDYKYTVKNSIDLLGPNCPYYDIHCPIKYNKWIFQAAFCANMAIEIDLKIKWGYCIKSVYGAHICHSLPWGGPFENQQYPDLKINESLPAAKIRQLLTGRPWFSIGDKAFNGGIRQVLQDLYPHKSRYE